MLPISEQYVSSPCEVKTMADEPLLFGYITEVNSGDGENIVISGKNGDLPVIHCNTRVTVNVFNSLLGFKVLVGVVFVSSRELLKVTGLQSAADYEKRHFFRVKVRIQTDACKMLDEDIEQGYSEQRFPIVIHNLSLSGAAFEAAGEQALRLNDRICIILMLYGRKAALLAKIVRIVNNGGADTFGCEFLDNTGRQFDLLARYLLDCQREQIQLFKQNRM